MTRSDSALHADFCQVMIEAYTVNEQMNQIVLAHLDPAAWRAQLRGSKHRTIAAIFSHVHNIRRKWLRLSASHLALPAPLERTNCTIKQARAALAESGARCSEMLAGALQQPDRQPELFCRDGWAKPWPAGPATLAYMLTHDAHHRGQVTMLAHQLGYPLPPEAAREIWAWEKLWKQCGFSHPR